MAQQTPPAPQTIALSTRDQTRADLVTGNVSLRVGDEQIAFAITLPSGACTTQDILPVMNGFSDLFADRGTAAVERQGLAISCRAGCGACCRQLVPIARAEAVALADLVDAMPEPRQSVIRARFDAALATVEEAGMLDKIQAGGRASTRERGLAYFSLGIACPFLEDESCSIYLDRPLTCREYLVTSPAERCAAPTPETIDTVPIQARPSRALLNAEPEHGWMAIILALRVAAGSPSPMPVQSGPAILKGFVDALR